MEPQTRVPCTGEEGFSGFRMNKGERERSDVSN